MGANERQEGGDHYGKSTYQHWDFVHDARLSYHAGCASKYPVRWRDKGGKLDLQKSIHFIDKCAELGVQGSSVTNRYVRFWVFVEENRLPIAEACCIFYIMEGQWDMARAAVKALLDADA